MAQSPRVRRLLEVLLRLVAALALVFAAGEVTTHLPSDETPRLEAAETLLYLFAAST